MEPTPFFEPQAATSEIVDGYHANLLIVGARREAARFANAPAFHTLAAAADEAPGLHLLSVLEQTGAVRGVYPLGRPSPFLADAAAAMGAVGAMVAAAAPADGGDGDRLAGTSVVELRSDYDVPQVLAALAADPQIEFASRVPVRYLVDDESVLADAPLPAAQPPVGLMMWNLVKIDWAAARAEAGFVDAGAIRVGVLDTGIDPSHPDLAHAIDSYLYRYANPVTPVSLSDRDVDGHGTHVAGTIAAGIGNGIGVHGICGARIHAYKIFEDQPTYIPSRGQFLRVVHPIAYRLALGECLRAGLEVINLSIGGAGKPDPAESALYADLLARGTVVVAAMGNGGPFGPISYPAAIPGVIAVGATRPDDRIAGFSSAGPHISLSAPGTQIWSTLPTYPGNHGFQAVFGPGGTRVAGPPIPRDVEYGAWQGTSMAAPHVAAAAALVLANRGPMSPAAVRQRLTATADSQPWMTHDRYGAGRLDLYAALFP